MNKMKNFPYFYSSVIKTDNRETAKNNYIINVLQNTTGSIMINYFTKNSTPVTLRVADMNGRIIAKTIQQSVSGNNKYEFTNITSIHNTQVLVVQVATGNEIYTHKIVAF